MSNEAPSLLTDVLMSGFIGQGQKVEEFEDALQKELKTERRPVTVNSCTHAIDLALALLNVGPGDEVIATPQTCFASQIGVLHRHARIRWADIDSITGLMDPNTIQNLITNKTKAIIAVNWAGRICDYKKIKSFGIPVIEDAAHTWDVDVPIESERGDYICYSFQAIKYLTSGDGGALICPNEEKEHEAKILRWFGLDRTKGESFRCSQNITRAGYKYHMNDINASIGLANINEAKKSVIKQKQNTQYIIKNVKNNNLILPVYDEQCSFWLFSMHVLNNRKQEFIDYLKENEISSSPVHYRNDLYDSTIQFKEKDLPGVTSFNDTQVCIPNGWWLTDEELNKIINTLNNFK